MSEIWKDIPGYKGLYQASDLGRVKSLHRIIMRSNGIKQTINGHMKKPSLLRNGYFTVILHNVKYKQFYVHQLVAMAFFNHSPNKFKIVVDHIDFDKTNNALSNLRLLSNRENTNQKHSKSRSKYTGVFWDRKKWRSSIRVNGKRIYLGSFMSEIDASKAYQN